MNDIDTLREAGFSEDEISAHKQDEAATLRSAGFSDEEIASHYTGLSQPRSIPEPLLHRFTPARREAARAQIGRLGTVISEGAKAGFGEEPIGVPPEDEAKLRQYGVWAKPEEPPGFSRGLRLLNEAAMKPAYVASQTMFRSVNAAIMAAGAATGQFVGEISGDPEHAPAKDFAEFFNIAAILAGAHTPMARPIDASVRAVGPRAESVRSVLETNPATNAEVVGHLPKSQDFTDAARIIDAEPVPPERPKGTLADIRQKLIKLYETDGIHPAEVASDAKTDPSIASAVAHPDPEVVPPAYSNGNGIRTPTALDAAVDAIADHPATGVERRIAADVRGKLLAAGMPEGEVDLNAALFATRWYARAAQRGRDPWDMYQQANLEIQAGGETEARAVLDEAKQREFFQGETEKPPTLGSMFRSAGAKRGQEKPTFEPVKERPAQTPEEIASEKALYERILEESRKRSSAALPMEQSSERLDYKSAGARKQDAAQPLPEFKPKIGQDAYDEGYAHARRGIGRRQGVYDQKNYDLGYFAGREGRPRELFQSSRTEHPWYYSAVVRAVDDLKVTKASPEQWLNTIRNRPGVKAEELEWLGLEDWLKEQKGPVTKQEVQEYIRANQIEVREVQKGGEAPPALQDEHARLLSENSAMAQEYDRLDPHSQRALELIDRMNAAHDRMREIEATEQPPTKFGQWQLPGGENYRELLLTLPDAQYEALTERARRIARDNGEDFDERSPTGQMNYLDAARRELGESYNEARAFRDTHWDEPNVVGWVRMNDRIIDGKKTLLVEEFQENQLIKERRKLKKLVAEGKATDADRARIAEIEKQVPFVDTWHELLMKRMLRYAAENGYDKLAWTSGETQAARYDLSKQISRLDFEKRNNADSGMLTVWDHVGLRVTQREATAETLADIVGKEVAEKLLAQEKKIDQEVGPPQKRTQWREMQTLSGLDLKVGGEGMKGFYDQILPAAANKLVKKYGARTSFGDTPLGQVIQDSDGIWTAFRVDGNVQGHFDTEAEAREALVGEVHTLDLTPSLKEAAITQGFPLFQRGEAEPRGKITISWNRAIIELFKLADASTFLHESGHLWLEQLIADAQLPDASPQLKADLETVLDWFGVEKPEDITDEHHEQWARGFERYVAEGKAPKPEMQGIFDRFKQWLLAIYHTLEEFNSPISDEIRGVYDRLFLTPEEMGIPQREPVQNVSRETLPGSRIPSGATGFTTAKGSTYQVHEDGTTTRNKAARADVGHEGDFGPKTRSEKTVYAATPEQASVLSSAGLQNVKGSRVIIKDGKASLLTWNEQAGRWGRAPSATDIQIFDEPAVGRAPVELWKKTDDIPGYEAYKSMHAGNAITEISPKSQAEPTPAPARAHSAAAQTGNPAVDAVINDPVVKARIDNPTIDNSSEVPYGAGASAKPDDPTTHLDKSIPREATISGVTFDPAVPANIHEQVERAVMEREIARFKAEHGREPNKAEMEKIWDYAHHDFAEPAEDTWVRAHGIDVHEYDIQWVKWLRKTSTEDTADAPPDLYRKPYNATPEGRLHGDKDMAALSDEEAAKKLFAERPPGGGEGEGVGAPTTPQMEGMIPRLPPELTFKTEGPVEGGADWSHEATLVDAQGQPQYRAQLIAHKDAPDVLNVDYVKNLSEGKYRGLGPAFYAQIANYAKRIGRKFLVTDNPVMSSESARRLHKQLVDSGLATKVGEEDGHSVYEVAPERIAPRITPEPTANLAAEIEPRPIPSAEIPNSVATFRPSDLIVDAKRFQFKDGGDEAGVTERLKGVTKWDSIKAGMVLVWQDKAGRNFIVDGHQRHALASRIEAADPTQKPELFAHVLREADGITDRNARTTAALKNIAEGTGTAIDAAKVLRENPDRAKELPPRSEIYRQALALANLSPENFTMVVNEIVPQNYAAVVGRLVPGDHELQRALLQLLAKTEPANIMQAESIVQQGIEAGTAKRADGAQGGLFGDDDVAESLYLERAKVLDMAFKEIKQDKKIFSVLTKEQEAIEAAGNKLAADINEKRAAKDAQALQLIERLATRKGPISDALGDAARAAKSSGKYADAARSFVQTLRDLMERHELARLADGIERGAAHVGDENTAGIIERAPESADDARVKEAESETRALFQRAKRARVQTPDLFAQREAEGQMALEEKRQTGWFHGGREEFDPRKVREVYMVDDPNEAAGYAAGGHLGGYGKQEPRVSEMSFRPGKTKNIDHAILEAMDEGIFDPAFLDAEMERARAEGYRYVSYSHPGFLKDEQNVLVSLHPKEDVLTKEQAEQKQFSRIGQGELAQRKAEEPLKPTVEQRPMDIGLFGDEAKQKTLFQPGREFEQAAQNTNSPEGKERSRMLFHYDDRGGFAKFFDRVISTWQRTFQPQLVSDLALRAEPFFRSMMSQRQGRKDVIAHMGEAERQYWRGVGEDENFAYLSMVERGQLKLPQTAEDATAQAMRSQKIGEWQEKAVRHREMLDAAHDLEKQYGSRAAFIEDYIGHLFEDPVEARNFFMNRGRIMGPTWFQKERVWDYIDEARAHGLRLKSNNSEWLVSMRLFASADMVEKMDLLYKLRDELGAAVQAKNADPNLLLRGWQEVRAPNRERWLISRDLMPTWDNSIEAYGLLANPGNVGDFYRMWMAFKNAWVPIKLSISGFHPVHVLEIAWFDGLAAALKHVVQGGDPVTAMKIAGRSLIDPLIAAPGASIGAGVGATIGGLSGVIPPLGAGMGAALGFLGGRGITGRMAMAAQGAALGMTVPGGALVGAGVGAVAGAATLGALERLGLVERPYHPGRFTADQWRIPFEDRTPLGKAYTRILNEAGTVPTQSAEMAVKGKEAFEKAWDNRQWGRAILPALSLAIKTIQAPIFEQWIPALKTASVIRQAELLLDRRPDLIDNNVQRRAALTQIGKSADARFGEMFYGNLFWDAYVKDVGKAYFLSLGWQIGGMRDTLAGPVVFPVSRAIRRIARGPATETEQTIAYAQNIGTYSLAYLGGTMLIAGMISMANTGETPQGLDWFLPRSGRKNPDGSDHRLTTQSYTREIPMALKHIQERGGNIPAGLAEMAYDKSVLQPFVELARNQDYWGTEVMDENSPFYKQWGQAVEHFLGDQVNPMSLSGAQRALLTGGRPEEAGLALLGFGPAPAYAERSATQNRIQYLYGLRFGGTRPMEEGEKATQRSDLKNEILLARQSGDTRVAYEAEQRWLEAGGSPRSLGNLLSGIGSDVSMFRRLPEGDQEAIMARASPGERQKYEPYFKPNVARDVADLMWQQQIARQSGDANRVDALDKAILTRVQEGRDRGQITDANAFRRSIERRLIEHQAPELGAMISLPKRERGKFTPMQAPQ